MLLPDLLHVMFEGRTQRTEVVEASDSAIDLKGGHVKELSFAEVLDLFAVEHQGCWGRLQICRV